MNLVQFSLKNPYAIIAIAIGVCLMGMAMIPSIPVDLLPDFKTPVVVSFFTYPGLPTIEMEKSVSERVERILTLAGGVEHQESRTLPGVSVLRIFFHPGTDPHAAMNDVVNLEMNDMFHLPPGIEFPFSLRGDPANLPVILAGISGEGLTEADLYRIGYYAVRNKLGGQKGVQIPHPFGGKFRQMMVYVDPIRLHAHNLSLTDVVDALRKSNLVMAAGSVRVGDTDYQVHPTNTLPTTADIDAVPIAIRDGKPIFIRDVGYAKDDAAIQNNIVRVDGARSVYVPLMREPGRNTIEVVDQIHESLAHEIPIMKDRGEIPQAAEVTLLADQSTYIRTAVKNLGYEVGTGALLVLVVVAMFLRRFLPTLIIVAVIALSLIGGALAFFFTGHSINVMTLGGLSLAVGAGVDAGIVVVENIMRHLRMGKSSHDASLDGASEMAAPVLAGTVTNLAVFIPVIFLSGMVRYLFEPLSISAALTIAAAYLVAMTVVPPFCAKFLKAKTTPGAHNEEEIVESRGLYARMLAVVMRFRLPAVIGILLLMGSTLLLLPHIGSELFPDVDAGTFEIRVKTRAGTRIEETEKLVIELENIIRETIPAKELVTLIANIGLPVGKGAGFSTVLSSNSGPDSAYLIVNLTQEGRRTATREYVERLRERFTKDFPSDKFLFVSGGIINAALNEGVAAPISIQVSGASLDAIRKTAEEVATKVRSIPGAVDVQIAQTLDYPQLEIEVDRTRAKYMGLNQEDVAKAVLTALGSSVNYAPTIWLDPATGIDFFMGVQYATNEMKSLEEIQNIPLSIPGPDGAVTVPLANIATVKRVSIPGEISHFNIGRVYDVLVNVSGRDVGGVARDVERAVAEVKLDTGIAVKLRGPVATMKAGTQTLGMGLAVAVALVYLVMVAQFRSFVDPLIIMLAVPLGVAGVIVTLYLTNTTLNIQSLMGTMMLVGVVVSNSILLVEFANVLRERGYDARRAATLSAQVRLRPVLMTAFTLLASMLPVCFHIMPGGEAMIPLARALVGGMLVSTAMTLFLVPCVYSLVKRDTPAPATA